MSSKTIENEIYRSLATKNEEVICISGNWGVGKTYAWKEYLRQARNRVNGIALKRYAYVSLFGITSLDEFRQSIFQNTINTAGNEVEPSLATFQSNTVEVVKQLGRKSIPLLQYLPFAKNSVGGLAPVFSFLAVRETIICVDDIERRGDKLSMRDVLGLVSSLKEQRKCKIILILNDNAEDKEKEQFKTYFEKVVDINMRYAPTPAECVQIALSDATEIDRYLGQCCVTLGISNIRVIKKIVRFVRAVEPMLQGLDDQVLKQAVQTIVIMSWCVYEPENAPTIEFLKERQRIRLSSEMGAKKVMTDVETTWNALLISYNFTSVDQFDLALLDGVKNGYFDAESVMPPANELDRKYKTAQSFSAFSKAWDIFHNSFDDNGDEVAESLYHACIKNLDCIDLANLDITIRMLKELERENQAYEIISNYTASDKGDVSKFDLENYSFGNHVTDPDFRKALTDKLRIMHDNRDPESVLLSMSGGWNHKDIAYLYSMDADAYYRLFKSVKGEDRRRIIARCLQFSSIQSSSDQEKEIAHRAKEALTRIGEESLINSIRVKNYGIYVDKIKLSKGAGEVERCPEENESGEKLS